MYKLPPLVIFFLGRTLHPPEYEEASTYLMYTTVCHIRLMERVVPFPFNNISLSVHDPFLIRSRSVHIFHPF